MASDGVVVHEIWRASVLEFLGFPLTRVELNGRNADWSFDAPSLDVEEYFRSYDSPEGLPLSNAKQYSIAFMRLSKIQNDLRRNEETVWVAERSPEQHSEQWWAAARKAVVARRKA